MESDEIRVLVDLVLRVDDPISVAAHVLAERRDPLGGLALPDASEPLTAQIRQLVDETLRACIAEHGGPSGVSLRGLAVSVVDAQGEGAPLP